MISVLVVATVDVVDRYRHVGNPHVNALRQHGPTVVLKNEQGTEGVLLKSVGSASGVSVPNARRPWHEKRHSPDRTTHD
jgi:hypothetical protein